MPTTNLAFRAFEEMSSVCQCFIPRVAGFIILSLKGLRRDEISCGVYGHIYLSVRLLCAGNDVTRPRAGDLMV